MIQKILKLNLFSRLLLSVATAAKTKHSNPTSRSQGSCSTKQEEQGW